MLRSTMVLLGSAVGKTSWVTRSAGRLPGGTRRTHVSPPERTVASGQGQNAASSNDAAGRPPQRRIPSRYQGEAAQPQGATAPPARFGDACTPVGQAPPASSLALSRQDGRFSSQPFTSLDSLQRAQQQQQQQLPTQRTIPPVHHTATQLAERVRSSAAASTSGASATSMEGLSQSLGLSRRGTPPAPPVLSGVPVERARLTLRDLLAERNIVLRSYSPGQQNHLPCPQCQGGDSKEKQFSILISDDGNSASWRCFRGSCGFSGGVSTAEPGRSRSGDAKARGKKEAPPVKPRPNFKPLSKKLLSFFAQRGITPATLERNRVAQETLFCPPLAAKGTVIAFPYLRGGEVVNVKYRTLDKQFWQVKGAEKVLYGLDDVAGQAEIVVVEGEMDKLAMEEAGFTNVVSVPDGAPQRAKEGDLPPPDRDVKYSYLWNCRGELDAAARIILATDNDAPGNALAEELARRLGRERCFRVRWPGSVAGRDAPEAEADKAYRKDANEVLCKDGPQAIRAYLEAAEPYPIKGLFRFSDFYEEIRAYYDMAEGVEQGVSTGWKDLDEYYKVVPGELTIVTGVPNSGKSEWIDALLCNLATEHGWSFAMCSMEKKVTDHARQLLEKYWRQPFFSAANVRYATGHGRRMEWDRVEEGLEWLDECFHLIRYEDEELPNIDWVLDLARAAVLRYGIRGLVIDPYNELDHQRPAQMNETEYVSQMLTKIKRFAQHHDVHVWFVAHPRQMRDWKGDPPNLYDISGSAHFINKCDNGIVVHRSRDPNEDPRLVKVLVRKVRNKAAGTIGDCSLRYNVGTGMYEDVNAAYKAGATNGFGGGFGGAANFQHRGHDNRNEEEDDADEDDDNDEQLPRRTYVHTYAT